MFLLLLLVVLLLLLLLSLSLFLLLLQALYNNVCALMYVVYCFVL